MSDSGHNSVEAANTIVKKPRRFAVEPVETTTRSSKDTPKQSEEPVKPRRRFLPEPVETSARSSKDAPEDKSQVNTVTKPRRKFLPEPVETSSRSSKDGPRAEDATAKPKRRFVPQPIETTATSSRQRREDVASQKSSPISTAGSEPSTPTRRRFAPIPIETTTFSNRSSPNSVKSSRAGSTSTYGSWESAPRLAHEIGVFSRNVASPVTPRPRRRFAPELVETATRTRKAGDTTMSVDADQASGRSSSRPRPQRVPSDVSEAEDEDAPPTNPAQRRIVSQGGSLSRRSSSSRRQHSYSIPRLESIESSESDESPDPPSLYFSNRADSEQSDTSDDTYMHKTRLRESADGSSSAYLLAAAAEAAKRNYLQEQAAAAYPNANVHEPVAHYVDDEEEDEEIVTQPRFDPTRRDSGDDKLAMEEMRRLAEKRLEPKVPKELPKLHGIAAVHAVQKEYEASPELQRMLEAARPPMLGDDIHYPRCASPEHARFDVTQGADFLRQQMCYLTQDTHSVDENGLWAPHSESDQKQKTKNTAKSGISGGTWTSNKSGTASPGGGLWGGFCTQNEARGWLAPGIHTPSRTPLATPKIERDDPFATAFAPPPALSVNNLSSTAPSIPGQRNLGLNLRPNAQKSAAKVAPVSPSPTHAAFTKQLEVEARLNAEFNDSFVTQVYNYLSLGFPSIAYKFDEELSRVTRIPVEELRQDDKLAGPRGHIRLGENEIDIWLRDVAETAEQANDLKRAATQGSTASAGSLNGVVEEDMCRRWRALRRYVREWGRQMLKKGDDKVPENIHDAWGMPPRRGSWGI